MELEVQDYLGRWYEIGHPPDFYEEECTAATADYSPSNGGVFVVNTCYRNGEPVRQIFGQALPTENDGIFELQFTYEVDFEENDGYAVQIPPSMYHVIWTDYDRFAIVAGADPRYYWVLARYPELTNDDETFIMSKINELELPADGITWN